MTTTRAVLLDALGTMIELEPPWLRLAPALGERPDARIERAFRAEIAYYKAHADEGRDDASLAGLRDRCATILSAELGREVSVEMMMASIRFRAYDDTEPALAELRLRGLRLVCVSNWDVSLGEVLDRCGLAGYLDGVVTSAAAGASKPDPAIFERALSVAGCTAAEAIHVGDTALEDVAGARAAGVQALLIDRAGRGEVASLGEIVEHLRP